MKKHFFGCHNGILSVIEVSLIGLAVLFTMPAVADSQCQPDSESVTAQCLELNPVTIIGQPEDAQQVAGSAHVVIQEELDKFEYSDVQRALRQVPGVALQLEDGYGLRPNISIRGTATERSGRITLLEDGVLIAPAPYAAPSAYYFPTFGRINQIEVLKGPAAITEGPYTVGGAINLLSSPIPSGTNGFANFETGSDSTHRVHASYGASGERYGWLLETHQWQGDGFQTIDRSDRDTGFNKQDWLAKFRINTDPGADGIYQQLDIKLQYADEQSNQSYLGLTDDDFRTEPLRRYGLSELDRMDWQHQQFTLQYLAKLSSAVSFSATAYRNNFERGWFKTEGVDPDGSANAAEFERHSWAEIIHGTNLGQPVAGIAASNWQAILRGEQDTAAGSIQLRANDREYYSRGLVLGARLDFNTGLWSHAMELGLRWHEDQEDRLQQNSSYHQQAGQLLLDDIGLLGNAGNRVQDARALSGYFYDTIHKGRLTLTPGLRFESIDQNRIRYETRPDRTADPADRSAGNFRSARQNDINVLIPGLGGLYQVSPELSLIAGIHKGFTAPTNQPGVDEEQSLNYEFGLRFSDGLFNSELIAFYTDYDNLLGFCSNASGADCEIGDAFNGDAATVAGLEFKLTHDLSTSGLYGLPVRLAYTYTDSRFDSDIADTAFFGDVKQGDPLPYIPEHQLYASLGLELGAWSAYLSANYTDAVCVVAGCGEFQSLSDRLILDLAVHYRFSHRYELYALLDNLSESMDIVGRHPYGARPGKDRSLLLGFKINL